MRNDRGHYAELPTGTREVVALALGLLLVGAPSAAQTADGLVRVRGSAPGCPSGGDLDEEIRRQLGDGALASARGIRVLVHYENRRSARVWLASAAGTTRARIVEAQECASLAEPIALVAVVLLENPAWRASAMPTQRSERSEPRRMLAMPITVGLEAAIGILPTPVVGWSVGTGFQLDAWSLHLSLGALPPARHALGHARASFGALLFDLGACGSPVQGIVDLELCLRASTGLVQASGIDVSEPYSRTDPWGSIGVTIAVTLHLADFIVLSLRPSLDVPLVREPYGFLDASGRFGEAFTVEPITLRLSLEAGVRPWAAH